MYYMEYNKIGYKHTTTIHMKQISEIVKLTILTIMSLVSVNISAQSVEAELQEYFYPFAKFSYIVTPNAENPSMVVTYSLSNGNILTKKTEIWNGYSAKKVTEDLYKLSIEEDRQAIVSTQQIIQNMLGTRRASDKLTMFVLPKEDKTISWEEIVNGESSSCSARFVFISFTFEGQKLYRKAVKIERTTPLDKSSSVKEWSYWVKGLSRLATYGYWGDPEKVSCIEKSVNIGIDNPVIEISEEEYNRIK